MLLNTPWTVIQWMTGVFLVSTAAGPIGLASFATEVKDGVALFAHDRAHAPSLLNL
jgi:hypothetical protein